MAKVVPPKMLTMDSLPGTREISRSMALIALKARPVWNSTSPIKTNKGIGVNEKLVTEEVVLRTHCARPASWPKKTQAPIKFTAKKANTTGAPIAMKKNKDPSIKIRADCQSIITLLLE